MILIMRTLDSKCLSREYHDQVPFYKVSSGYKVDNTSGWDEGRGAEIKWEKLLHISGKDVGGLD